MTSSRTALTVAIPSNLPAKEGATTTVQVTGYIAPYQVSLDVLSLQGCGSQPTPGQVVMGNMVMDLVPSYLSTGSGLTFRWTLFGVVPSANSLVEIPLVGATLGPLTPNNSTICRR